MGLKDILGLNKSEAKVPPLKQEKNSSVKKENVSSGIGQTRPLNKKDTKDKVDLAISDSQLEDQLKDFNNKNNKSKKLNSGPFSSLKSRMSKSKDHILEETEQTFYTQDSMDLSTVSKTVDINNKTDTRSAIDNKTTNNNTTNFDKKETKKLDKSTIKSNDQVIDRKLGSDVTSDLTLLDEKQLDQMLDNELNKSASGKKTAKNLFNLPGNIDKNSLHGSTRHTNLNTKTQSPDMLSDDLINLNHKRLPIVGKYSLNKQYKIAALIASTALVGLISGSFLYGNSNTKQNKAIEYATEFSSDIQKINTFFSDASLGKTQAYDNLRKVTEKAKSDLDLLKQQNSTITSNEALIKLQNDMQSTLNVITGNMEILHMQADILANSSEKVGTFTQSVNNLNVLLDNFINDYTQQPLNKNELANIYLLKSNLQSINGLFATILLSEKIDATLIANLNAYRRDVKNSLLALQVGDASRGINPITSSNLLAIYGNMTKEWVGLSGRTDSVVNKSAELIKARSLVPQNYTLINSLNQNINTALNLYKNTDLTGTNVAKTIIALSLLLLIFSMIVTFNIYSFEKDNRSLLEKFENNKNQSSILKLLTEMMPLQDGDLTKKTTVTEEITGAIADSINATIDSLASLVRKIKDTSFRMRQKTNEVNSISSEMLSTTEKQATTLNETGTSVIDIANAITEISKRTEKGANDAKNSVAVSEEGAKQVLDSVKSMREININMNETVLLMKKVNNSSAQIYSIAELLSDITEETSILALNAAVQAAKAGESGKGFKIVSDSIQELADKASDAARRVGTLISTVQTDIQAVEHAVQKTTQEVDKGVQLSELAGDSLNKMTLVSKDLSETVRTISEDAKSHADAARKVSQNMEALLKATEDNKVSTKKAASSILEISSIANELGDSVQSFKVE